MTRSTLAGQRRLQMLLVELAHADGDVTDRSLAGALHLEALASCSPPSPELDRRLAAALGEILARRGSLVYAYYRDVVEITREQRTDQRHHCGFPLLRSHITSPLFEGGDRMMWLCERCGEAFDLPCDVVPPRLTCLGDRRLRIELEAPRAHVVGSWTSHGGSRESPSSVVTVEQGMHVMELPHLHEPIGLRSLGLAWTWNGFHAIGQVPVAWDRW